MSEGPNRPGSEDEMREVERVMLYIAEAKRKAAEIARQLESAGSQRYIIDALDTAAAAMLAEHNRLFNRTHYVVPEAASEPIADFPEREDDEQPGDQQRMAI